MLVSPLTHLVAWNVCLLVAVVPLVLLFASDASAAAPGDQLWAKRYNGQSLNIALGACAHDSGNSYAVGRSQRLAIGFDIVFSNNDSTGTLQWVQSRHGLDHGLDEPTALSVDESGSLYLTGRTQPGYDSYHDRITLEYAT